QGLVTAVARALGVGHGDANAPGMAHGAGKGPARGGGFGFGHASVGDPGDNAFSTLNSPSQNTSHKGGTHDGRGFSSHSHSTQSLAQHQTDHSTKADQVVQVEDTGPGKEKGIVDSLPPGQELQPDRGMTLNLETIHSDLDDIVTLGPPDQMLQADPGKALNPDMFHSDLDDIVALGPPGQELQADPGKALNPDTFDSDLDDIATKGLALGLELNLNRGKSLPASRPAEVGLWTIVPDTDETLATAYPHRWELGDDRAKIL